jgi:hypothetical protein
VTKHDLAQCDHDDFYEIVRPWGAKETRCRQCASVRAHEAHERRQYDQGQPCIPWSAIEPYWQAWKRQRFYAREELTAALNASHNCVARLLASDTLTFSQADALLTVFGRVDVWHVELAEYYEEAA